jgi:hypothetical protein
MRSCPPRGGSTPFGASGEDRGCADRWLRWHPGVVLTEQDLGEVLRPSGGWPTWVTHAAYRSDAHPQAAALSALEFGANCQRYAYEFLALFDRRVPPHRSSELWGDANLTHCDRYEARDLDLALFNESNDAWGAHVAIVVGDRLLHLCAEEGRPAIWSWGEFATRARYSHLIGVIRSRKRRRADPVRAVARVTSRQPSGACSVSRASCRGSGLATMSHEL